MTKIHEIPIVIRNDRITSAIASQIPDTPSTSAVLAILNEIETKLVAFASDCEESSIDLRWLMSSPMEINLLRDSLGQGEVDATITTIGSTLVKETAIPCVWWVSHQDSDNKSLAEFIEITEIPELLRSDKRTINQGLDALRQCCARLESANQFSSMYSTPRS